jgi:hypothetical protein
MSGESKHNWKLLTVVDVNGEASEHHLSITKLISFSRDLPEQIVALGNLIEVVEREKLRKPCIGYSFAAINYRERRQREMKRASLKVRHD